MKVLGSQAPPRGLLIGFDDSTHQRLAALVPTLRRIQHLAEVDQGEWDFLIADAPQPTAAPHLQVLTLAWPPTAVGGPMAFVEGEPNHLGKNPYLGPVGAFAGSEFQLPEHLPAALAVLVEGSAFALALQHVGSNIAYATRWSAAGEITPFLLGSDGSILAGRVLRHGGLAEYWFVPWYISDVIPWVTEALARWRAEYPDRFLDSSDWRRQPAWFTSQEREIVESISNFEARYQAAVDQLNAERAELAGKLAEATAEGAVGVGRLLDAQGDALVDAAAGALRSLGFSVVNMDEAQSGQKSLKLEDLQVTLTREPDWIALAEVRGYKDGAKTHDFLRIGRFVEHYVSREGKTPSRRWYLVNQFIGTDPRTRQQAFAGSASDLDLFRESGGAVIDTVDLFRLVRDVEEGKRTAEEVQQELIAVTGRLDLESDGPTAVLKIEGSRSHGPQPDQD